MKLGVTLRELHRSETSLAHRFRRVGERHKADHEIFYKCGDLAEWSESHIRQLADAGRRYNVRLNHFPLRIGGALSSVREKVGEVIGRRPEPALLLLADLRSVHIHAAAVSLDWELLAQGAQVARDAELLTLVSRCHPQTLRQMRWANTMLKVLSPQTLMN